MHIEQFALIVDDYDEAIGFFVDVLGFKLVEDSPSLTNDGRAKRWVVVRPPGAATALLLAQADGARQARAVGDQFAGRVGLFLRGDDFEAADERMCNVGVESSPSLGKSRTDSSPSSSTWPAIAGTWSAHNRPADAFPAAQLKASPPPH